MGLKDFFRRISDTSETKSLESSLFTRAFSFRDLFQNQYERIDDPYRQNVWVYACINSIATNVSQTEYILNRTKRDGSSERVKQGPVYDLFQKVNPHMTRTQLWQAVVTDLLRCGMYFVVKESGQDTLTRPGEVPKELWVLNPEWVTEVIDEDSKLIVAWKYLPPNGQEVVYPFNSVCYGRLYDPTHAWKGLSPIKPSWQNILGDQYASVHQASLLKNKAVPEGILTSEGRLTPDQVTQIRERWEQRHAGPSRAGRIAVLEGSMSYQNVSFTADDLGLQDQQKWDREAILAAFRVPKFMLGITDDLNFAIAKESRRTFWLETVIPLMKQIEDVFQSCLLDKLSGTPLVGTFNLDEVEALQTNLTEKMKQATALRNLGYSLNEINARLELQMPDREQPDTTEEIGPGPGRPRETDRPPGEEEDASRGLLADLIEAKSLIDVMNTPETPDRCEDISAHHTDSLKGKLKNALWKLRKGFLKGEDTDALLTKFAASVDQSVDESRKAIFDSIQEEMSEEYPDAWEKTSHLNIESPDSNTDELVKLISTALSSDLSSRDVKSLFNQAGMAASLIAKTELVTFGNEVRHQILTQLGFTDKTWIASASCEDHQDMHGETVATDKKFSNGLLYPADPSGGSAIVGCACSLRGHSNEE